MPNQKHSVSHKSLGDGSERKEPNMLITTVPGPVVGNILQAAVSVQGAGGPEPRVSPPTMVRLEERDSHKASLFPVRCLTRFW